MQQWILTAAVTLVSGVVYAQAPSTYPTKPVHFIVPQAPEHFAKVLRADIVKWAKVVKDSGATLD